MKHVTQKDLAAIVGLSTRQVRNLEADGMPTVSVDGRKSYPLPEAVHWWRDREVERALEPFETTELQEERRRLVAAQADRAELDLAERRGELVEVEAVEATWASVLGLLRARIIATKGWAPRFVGLDSAREAAAVLGNAMDELLEELRGTADDVDAEAEGAGP